MLRPFSQVDVFGGSPYSGNPVAVVLEASDIAGAEMQRFARWANLSESTFILPPTTGAADYRLRIFTPTVELPFAGHPTLGSCHAWLAAGGTPRHGDEIVQECAAGLIRIRRSGGRLAFAAPPLLRGGPVEEALLLRIAAILGLGREDIVDAQWVDNGPGWVAVMLASAADVLALRPGVVDLDLGVVGPHPPGGPASWEVRAFFPKDGSTEEDPVTGSLNASLAGWLFESGRADSGYVARQGTAIGRDGRVFIERDAAGTIWVGGATVSCLSGTVEL